MPREVRIWRRQGSDTLCEISRSPLDLEARLEVWLERDISVLSAGPLVIGGRVETDFGAFLDLLCLDRAGDVVVVELKRDKTPREITAQILDCGSWIKGLSNERLTTTGKLYIGRGKLEEAFKRLFGAESPETLNENHRLLLVASHIDASSERIIKYLSDTYGVNINAATFHYFKEPNGSALLARVFLIEPAQVELQGRTKGTSLAGSTLGSTCRRTMLWRCCRCAANHGFTTRLLGQITKGIKVFSLAACRRTITEPHSLKLTCVIPACFKRESSHTECS